MKDSVKSVKDRIEAAAIRAGRDPADVVLLAATKNRSVREIIEAREAGIEVVGENRAQEMSEKWSEVGDKVEWHFIGHLQRNKVRMVVGIASLIHSVDSLRLAEEIDRRAGEVGKIQKVLIQVNLAEEESKYGIRENELAGLLERMEGLENVEPNGLSTIAPIASEPEQVRWLFKRLRELLPLAAAKAEARKMELSMGMTGDFEVAVEEGSTIVRIGTAIFGTV